MTRRRWAPALAALPLLAACGGNPAQQAADSVVGAVSTAHRAEVVAALAGDALELAAYQATTGSFPASQTEFDALPGVQRPGVRVAYSATSGGWCLVGTSSAQPPATVVWTPAGQQPAVVTSCS